VLIVPRVSAVAAVSVMPVLAVSRGTDAIWLPGSARVKLPAEPVSVPTDSSGAVWSTLPLPAPTTAKSSSVAGVITPLAMSKPVPPMAIEPAVVTLLVWGAVGAV